MPSELRKNPFTVRSPEDLPADEATALFVDVFTDFYKVRDVGHTMLHGPRGSGKSMIFRLLEPDCQCKIRSCDLSELEFCAVLIRIRNTELNLTELRRIRRDPLAVLINEHLLTMYVAAHFFDSLHHLDIDDDGDGRCDLKSICSGFFRERLLIAGCQTIEEPGMDVNTVSQLLRWISSQCETIYQQAVAFARKLAFPAFADRIPPFEGPLCGYLNFLFPLLCQIRKLPFMPSGPIYLLVDDADLLNETQTRVLNSWIATRTSDDVSIKVSTQASYKSYRAVSGMMVEAPHDFAEIDISDFYTTSRSRYLKRLREIVERRLTLAHIDVSPEELFPPFEAQEERIRRIADEIRRGEHELSGRSANPSDDALRYARPEYFRSLRGTAKNSPKYQYAGFEQLAHLSSGIIRSFLEPAAQMFSDQQAELGADVRVTRITSTIQNHVARREAEALMTRRFDTRISADELGVSEDDDALSEFEERKAKLRALIEVLGGAFHEKLVCADWSERRVFSVAFSQPPDRELIEIFELGAQNGYFQRMTIGNKEGTGRTPRYMLNRQLAPYFGLDPSGITGYLFITNEALHEAIRRPDTLLRRMKKVGVEKVLDKGAQPLLFST